MPDDAPAHGHTVQFFESEDFLCEVVADFITAGLNAGAPIVIVARSARLQALVSRLERMPTTADAGTAIRQGQLVMLDAAETLSKFMIDGQPDAASFRALMLPLIANLSSAYPRSPLRAYGEMVDILWSLGEPEAAIRLEALSHQLALSEPLSLLCAYRMDHFRNDKDGKLFAHICEVHTEVAASESSVRAPGADARRREVARMQQRIQALESQLLQARICASAGRPDCEKAARDERPPAAAAARKAATMLSILLVQDRDSALGSAILSLSAGSSGDLCVHTAGTTESALDAIEAGGLDLCFCVATDTGANSALDLLHACRRSGERLPFVAVTAPDVEDELIEMLINAGFEDVIADQALDGAAVQRLARTARLRGGRTHRLLEFGTVDELTGVLNRRGFLEKLELVRLRCEQLHLNLSVLYLDLNDFKQINDRHGHRVGDDTLKAFVAELLPLLRKSDVVGRIGGDEFAVALPGVDRHASEQIAHRLHKRLLAAPVPTRDSQVVMAVAVGIYTAERADALSGSELLDLADSAMYYDKLRQKQPALRPA
ncbi:MAG: hypothetical protein NVS9B10_03390 [Nevskia sp.]